MLKLLKNIKHISQKGTLFVEYAVLLAFVVTVGVVFLSDNTINGSITSIFAKVDKVLNGSSEPVPKPDPLAETLKHYASVFTSSAMEHTGGQVDGVRTYSLGKEMASGYPEPNFGNKMREAGIDAAYIGLSGLAGYAGNYSKLSADEKEAFLSQHYLPTNSGLSSIVVSTDGNTTWENGNSYNAVQYVSYQGKNEAGKTAQLIASYRNIVVNVDEKGKKTYTDTAGNPITINSGTDDGGGWQKFEK